MITHVHPEIRRELEVVGMRCVISFLFLQFVFRPKGIDRIGTTLHGLPMAIHEGNARREAMRSLPSLGQFVFSSDVQHVPAVEFERERVTVIQGLEHPVRLGQRVGQLPGEALGFHAGKEL